MSCLEYRLTAAQKSTSPLVVWPALKYKYVLDNQSGTAEHLNLEPSKIALYIYFLILLIPSCRRISVIIELLVAFTTILAGFVEIKLLQGPIHNCKILLIYSSLRTFMWIESGRVKSLEEYVLIGVWSSFDEQNNPTAVSTSSRSCKLACADNHIPPSRISHCVRRTTGR